MGGASCRALAGHLSRGWSSSSSYRAASTILVGPLAANRQYGTGDGSHFAWPRGSRYRASLGTPKTQTRGKKTKTSVKLEDLPQGPLKAEPLVQDEDEGPAYPTVVLQAKRNMQKFENCVLLTRVGGFYELYFGQAEEYGPLLNLKVARKKTTAGPVPMAGFPFFQLERFLKILVQDLNCYVAVAEEFPNDPGDKVNSGLMHDRKVARIITPGTLIDENFIDPYANNYVMAIHLNSSPAAYSKELDATVSAGNEDGILPDPKLLTAATPIGLAWLDISTGHFYTQSTIISSLPSILSRVGPKEIVIDEIFQSQKGHGLFSILAEDKHLITHSAPGKVLPLSEWTPMLESEIPAQTIDTFTQDEVQAGSLLLQYVENRLQGLSMKLQPPLRHEAMQVLTIDKNSMRSLEIKQTIRDGYFRGSLLHAVRRTVTKSGARLLNEWLTAPSTSLEIITQRQDLVGYFLRATDLRDEIILLLRRTHDSQRLVQKFALGRGDPDDLVALANTIVATENIIVKLKEQTSQDNNSESNCFSYLTDRVNLDGPAQLAQRIQNSIDEEGIYQQHQAEDDEAGQMLSLAEGVVVSEGSQDDAAILPKSLNKRKKPVSIRDHYADDNMTFIMQPSASPGLKTLHADLNALLQEKETLGDALRERFGAASLTLKWSPNLGHICHVKGKDTRKISDEDFRAVSSSRSTRTFHVPDWTALGQRLHRTRFQIQAEEQKLFADLRAQVVRNLVRLRRNAAVLDELDVGTSFARLAQEQRLVRPVLRGDGTGHTIIGGRHPTVEGGLWEQGRSFTKNDCLVGAPGQGRLWLITGPNMAGKSTYLRQNALITILAQAGCYVPADHAELGVVDAIFSRVGSADNLYRDQSTFMVEMLETAQILRSATPRSFVIMDEIGRGTTPEDGAAVAFAALHQLVHINRSRVLFATHFHSLADLVTERGMHVMDGGAVEMYCTDVEEDGAGGFVYVHKLRKGINRHSHALKVARLAGLPEAAIKVAKEILGEATTSTTTEAVGVEHDDIQAKRTAGVEGA